MNKRSREILSQLITKTEYNQTISIQELADTFKVSSRTIRYDIDQINDYLKENAVELRNEVSVTGQYNKVSSKSYETTLRATERGDLLLELKLSVPDEKTATAVCEQWQKKNEDIYALIMKELFG